jgi:hypothetical protein
MQTDAFFVIGASHSQGGKPCQDYAVSGILPDGSAYAVVSDGCSTGGRTDVGSRLVALSMAQAIQQQLTTSKHVKAKYRIEQLAMQQRFVAASSGNMLGCINDDLLATCLYVYASPKGGFAHIRGDGILAWQEFDGSIKAIRFDWNPDNPSSAAPFYPAYAADNCAGFVAYYGGDLDAIVLRSEQWEMLAGETEFVLAETVDYTLSQGIRGPVVPLTPDMKFVAVFTDGVTQIEGVDWKDAVAQLLSFKTTAGDFAKRRMNRVVRESQKIGHGPLDDLAYAVVYQDNEES